MLYYVKKANVRELNEILAVIENGRDTLREHDIPQWRNGDGPNEARIKMDLALGEGYCLIEGNKIIGYGTITSEKQSSYEEITNGSWEVSDNYASLHRVVIHSAVKEKGKGQFFLGHLISGAFALGYHDIRIDTHPANLRMQRVIEKAGFCLQGDIILDVADGERKAYQVIL